MGINASVLCLALLSAAPEQPQGLYVKLSGLWVDQENSDLTSGGGPAVFSLEFGSGYGGRSVDEAAAKVEGHGES